VCKSGVQRCKIRLGKNGPNNGLRKVSKNVNVQNKITLIFFTYQEKTGFFLYFSQNIFEKLLIAGKNRKNCNINISLKGTSLHLVVFLINLIF